MSENLSTNLEQKEVNKSMKMKIIIGQQRGLKKSKSKCRVKSLNASPSQPKATENGTCKYCDACVPLADMKQHYMEHILVQNPHLIPENLDKLAKKKKVDTESDKRLVQENSISSTNHVADFTNMALAPSTGAKMESFLDLSVTPPPSASAKKDEFEDTSSIPHIPKSSKDDACPTIDLTITTPAPSTSAKSDGFVDFSNTDPAPKSPKNAGTQVAKILDYTNIASAPSTSGEGVGLMDSSSTAEAPKSVKDDGSQSNYTDIPMMTPAPSTPVKNDNAKDTASTNSALPPSSTAKRSKYMDFYNNDIDDISQYNNSFSDDSLGWNFKSFGEKQENDPLPPPPFKVSVQIIFNTSVLHLHLRLIRFFSKFYIVSEFIKFQFIR